jgi:nucleoside-diphosphate-sugar epimerase
LARALIVGCGCRGRSLGLRLAEAGWTVRGTTRDTARRGEIEAAGIEAAVADPARPGTIFELVGDVTVIHWLLGDARAGAEELEALHGVSLEALLEKLVDTPVRGFVYEAAGGVPAEHLQRGAKLVRSAAQTWRIPVEVVSREPADHQRWLDAMAAATARLTGS